jgi:translation initiation factor IF-3
MYASLITFVGNISNFFTSKSVDYTIPHFFFHKISKFLALVRRPFPTREPKKAEHRINEFIRVPQVRLAADSLELVSAAVGRTIVPDVYNTHQVREWAEMVQLDVVEIAANAVPPVVKIIDYNKFLYQKRKREKEMKANSAKQEMKEIRFGPETAEHDFDFKLRHAKTFLEEGSKVKAYVQFRGRAIVFKERGELLLLRFMKELEELGAADQMPKLEGRRMLVILSPKKTIKK